MAPKKLAIVTGILKPRMVPVVTVPNSGSPDVSSNTQPTAAIAATQAIAKNKPLLGVSMGFDLLRIFAEFLLKNLGRHWPELA